MTFLPIVDRELRVAARRPGTFWSRQGVALAAILIGACIFLVNFGAASATVGQYIFIGLSVLSFFYCLLSGRRSTADCLSEEKREGTLGLLFLTDLKGYDVVLGKLVATSVGAFYGLLAVFPVLAIPLLMGGVTNGEFWRVVLVLVVTFLFSLAIGIFSSAVNRDLRQTMALNFALLLLFTLVMPASAGVYAGLSPLHTFVPEFCLTSPGYALFLASDLTYKTASSNFWVSLGIIHGLTWLLLMLSARIVPHSWQDQPPPPTRAIKTRWRAFWHTWSYGRAAQRPAYRKQLLDINAFYWLAARARLKPLHVWLFMGLIACWWIGGRIYAGNVWLDETIRIALALMLNSTLKLWIIIEGSQRIAEDKKIGAMELLLSTPLEIPDIVRGQFLALRRQFFAPFVVILLLELFLMFSAHGFVPTENVPMTFVWLAGIVMLIADLLTLPWVAMSRALTAKSHHHAILSTMVSILMLPWLGYGLVLGVCGLWSVLTNMFPGGGWEPGWKFLLAWWFGLGLAADLFFGLAARRRVLFQMRDTAIQRFAPPLAKRESWFTARKKIPAQPAKIQQPKITLATAPEVSPASGGREGQGENSTNETSRIEPIVTTGVTDLAEDGVTILPLRSLGGRGEGRGEVRVAVQGGGAAHTSPQTPPAYRRKIFRYLIATVLIGLCAAYFLRSKPPQFPPPVIVPTTPSQGSLQVFPSAGGALFILPDGSLWRWGQTGMLPSTQIPEPIGTNRDYVVAEAAYNNCIALRRDGTIWAQWPVNPSGGPGPTGELLQLDPSHDWSDITTHGDYSFAIKKDGTLWTWGQRRGRNPSGSGPSVILQTNLTQVGADTDWATVRNMDYATLALKRDGTLWAWGTIYPGMFNNGGMYSSPQQLPAPVQVCRETNWLEFTPGFRLQIRNRSGEIWEPFAGPPNAASGAVGNCHLVYSNALPHHVAFTYYNGPKIYEIRGDGTLWQKEFSVGPFVADPAAPWHQVGKRRDWQSLWSASGTSYGLTADGTLWTWGIDNTRAIPPDFWMKLRMLQARLKAGLFTSRGMGGNIPSYQTEPRPLLRLAPEN